MWIKFLDCLLLLSFSLLSRKFKSMSFKGELQRVLQYFTVKTINKRKEHSGMEPFFEDDTSSVCSDIIPKEEINKIYNLLKHQSKDEFDPEDNKIDILEQVEIDGSSDENDSNNQEITNKNFQHHSANLNEKVNHEGVYDDSKQNNFDNASNSWNNSSRGSTTVDPGTNLLAFMLEEDHFGAIGGIENSNNKSNNDEENKDKGIVKIKFEEAINEETDKSGMTPRAERVSNIVQEVTIDDFDMIRFLGDGSYGKVNLVKCRINNVEYALKILDKK